MKHLKLILCLICLQFSLQAQSIDSFFALPQQIELKLSTPQPRMGETFQLELDINHLRANLFKSLAGIVKASDDFSLNDNHSMVMNVTAIKPGHNEIKPLHFVLDKTEYTSNALSFDVLEPLPNVDEGIWIRGFAMPENKICIIVEQRIPASDKTKKKGKSTTYYTEPETTEYVQLKQSHTIKGINGFNSNSQTNFSRVEMNGEERKFMYSYSVYYFERTDPQQKIIIGRDNFSNMPSSYTYKEIVID